MAKRPVFIASKKPNVLVEVRQIEFVWHPGLSLSQKRKSIKSLHDSAKDLIDSQILEISSKSPDPVGVALSAFNLTLELSDKRQHSLECVFQASKVFQQGGPYTDLLEKSPKDAKRDIRLKSSGLLLFFKCDGEMWPLQPATAFYDWLYITALSQNPQLSSQLLKFSAFTDIEFNPEKSINCQARSASLFVSLRSKGLLAKAVSSKQSFLEIVSSFSFLEQENTETQGLLF